MSETSLLPKRNVNQAIIRGFKSRCPQCGDGKLFSAYLKLKPSCDVCHEDLSEARADDFPPYLVIFIVGHIVVPLVLWFERAYDPSYLSHILLWLPLTVILSLLLLPPMKGAVVGLQWGARLMGFAGKS